LTRLYSTAVTTLGRAKARVKKDLKYNIALELFSGIWGGMLGIDAALTTSKLVR
jgi:hypothetical protein